MREATRLAPSDLDQVLALVQVAANADGVDPLSEHVVAHLPDAAATHLLAVEGDQLIGYANVDSAENVELCVHPLHRRRGVGRTLATTALGLSRQASFWAHGDHPSANALAGSLGLVRVRELWQLRRPLAQPVTPPVLPPGVILRPFRPGVDDEEWLALNARAFVDLPDQGSWTLRDLRDRFAEPWFDPYGHIVAARASDGAMLGFHWTKVHSGQPPLGEVYVLGVDPAAHGTGLGAALTLAGLAYLRDRGLAQVMLYVESTNAAAIRLYQRLGFVRWVTHVRFTRP